LLLACPKISERIGGMSCEYTVNSVVGGLHWLSKMGRFLASRDGAQSTALLSKKKSKGVETSILVVLGY
jgi:phage host-nuclease inhibitor protein Gam